MSYASDAAEGDYAEALADGTLGKPLGFDEDPTAQDVIDALRVALTAQKDPAEVVKIVDCLVEFAPDTESSRGIDLLLRLISEASLKVSLTDG